MQEAKRRGAKLIAIDPYRSQTAEKCHEHSRCCRGPTPRSRSAMMHVLIGEELHRPRLHRALHDRLRRARERVHADYPPQRVGGDHAASSSAQIVAARARVRAHAARCHPTQLRHAAARGRRHGGAHHRVPAGAVGAWRDPAGGVLLSSSGTYPVDHAALERPDLIRGTPRTINMTDDRRCAAERSATRRSAPSTSTTRTRLRSHRTRRR